jgi:hypothetical protein
MHPLIATYTSDELATGKALNFGSRLCFRYLARTARVSLVSVKLGHPSFGGVSLQPFRTPTGENLICLAYTPRNSVRDLNTKTP